MNLIYHKDRFARCRLISLSARFGEKDCKGTTFFRNHQILQKKFKTFFAPFFPVPLLSPVPSMNFRFLNRARRFENGCKGTTFFKNCKLFLTFFCYFFENRPYSILQGYFRTSFFLPFFGLEALFCRISTRFASGNRSMA